MFCLKRDCVWPVCNNPAIGEELKICGIKDVLLVFGRILFLVVYLALVRIFLTRYRIFTPAVKRISMFYLYLSRCFSTSRIFREKHFS